MDSSIDEKVRENRLRRMAQRQDLIIRKSRRRDPRAHDYGIYHLFDPYHNAIVLEGASSLDEIEEWLTRDPA